MTDTNSIYNRLGVSDQVLRFGQEVLEGLTDQFRHIDLNIFFSQRLQSFFDYFLCFLKRNLHADLIHHRRIKVIHVKLIHAQRFFAKRHIAVHQRQTLMYSVNELCIYRNRNLASVKSHGKR